MDFALTDEQRAFQGRFDAVCRERIAPRAREADRRGAVPAETWADLARAGYLQLFHPPELGGSGADGITQALAMECLARACASTFWAVTISTALCGKILHDLCAPEHHRRWLAPIVRGERIGCFAATEAGAGSDPGSYRTTVIGSGRGYRLRGEKTKISNASIADVAVVLARPDPSLRPPSARPNEGLCYVVVDLSRPGVRRTEIDKLGLRGMSWGTLGFDDVEVGEGDVIFDADMHRTLGAVEWGQILQSFCALGVADAALAACVEHVSSRQAFGRPLAHLQLVHSRLAQMRAEIDAARLVATEATWIKAGGRPARELVVIAKIYATEMAVRVVDGAMRTFGGEGYRTDHVVERLYRDALANVPGGLPTDRLRELLACGLLGADPWVYAPFDWLTPAGLRLGAADPIS